MKNIILVLFIIGLICPIQGQNYDENQCVAGDAYIEPELERSTNEDLASVQNYYLTDSVIQSDALLEKLGASLANRCDEYMENYEEAIAWYESVITDENTSFNDSIFATIDLGNLYLMIEEAGDKGIKGKLPQFVPKSRTAHIKQTDYALSLLPKKLNNNTLPVNDKPVDFWIDVVTEQPEGYVVDETGDVHIYSAEGLAWLASVSNGLNGQTADDFYDKTVFLEEDINMDGHNWYPISAYTIDPNGNAYDNRFRGVFEGSTHTIKNLLFYEAEGFSGLFQYVEYGQIRNVVIKDFKIDKPNRMYGIYAYYLKNGLMDHCYAIGAVLNGDEGGMIYEITNSNIRNSMIRYTTLKTNSSSAGWCENNMGTIENCASIVDTLYYPMDGAAGFVDLNQGTVKNCYSYWGELKDFPYYSGYAPRRGVANENSPIGVIENCYYNVMDESYSFNELPVDQFADYGITNDALAFNQDAQSWRLTQPITIGTTQADDLLEVLNLWVNNQSNSEDYLSWVADDAEINLGLPVFNIMFLGTVDEKPEDLNICIYPNPASDMITISGNDIRQVNVYNMVGQQVVSKKGTGSTLETIELSSYDSGIYLFKVTVADGTIYTERVIKK